MHIFLILLLYPLFLPYNLLAMNNNNFKNSCPELTGRVVTPQDPGYDEARLTSNYYPSKNQFPNIIVFCQNAQDVQNAVKWARCKKKSVRIRSGGHNHEAFSTGSGVIVIDVSEMKQLKVDKANHFAWVESGVTGKELYKKLYDVGLTQVGGTCSDVGFSGLVLTGGMGPLLRRHGLTCDNLISFEMVNAKGNVIHVDKNNEYKDLFWACCGGGAGNFGVVTSMTIKVYPAKPVTWFNIGWDWNQSVEQVIAAWQNFFSKNDQRWFSHLDIWAKAFPLEKFKKMPVKALGVFWGTPDEARRELAPLLQIGKPQIEFETVNWDKAIKLFEDSTNVFITDKPEYKSSGSFVMNSFPVEGIKMITETLQKSPYPLLNVLLFSLGGVAKEVPPTATAYFYRDANFFAVYSSQWLNEKDAISQTKELDDLRNRLLPFTQGNYTGNPDRNLKDYLKDYYGDNVKRLRCIKSKYDPENLFNHEQSIPPAPSDWDCSQFEK